MEKRNLAINYEKAEKMAVDLTERLIRFNNQNPPGSDREIAEYISDLLKSFGLKTEITKVNENVYCLRAFLGNPNHAGLLFSGHLDVVTASGNWKHEPFNPVIENGRMYGRGSCDMKSGMASMIAAAACLAENTEFKERGLALVFNGDEEISNLGMIHINKLGWLKADAAIIGEPTECQIHLGNRGSSNHALITEGIACHASNPNNGVNAIYKMAEAIVKLRDYAAELNKNVVDKYLGPATLSVDVVNGGREANIVPNYCKAVIDRRLLWKEDPIEVRDQIQQVVGDLGKVELFFSCPASLIDAEHPLVTATSESIRSATGEEPVVTIFPASTEGAFLSLYNNIPTLICGPGSVKQAHTLDEWVEVEQIRKAVRIYIDLALRWLG